MKDLLNYYLLTFAFYLIEILLFTNIYAVWKHDIFWLNILIRFTLALVFSIIVRNIIFNGVNHFYLKYFVLVLFNPLLSSSLLKLSTIFFPMLGVVILKILTDLISSLFIFFTLKKFA